MGRAIRSAIANDTQAIATHLWEAPAHPAVGTADSGQLIAGGPPEAPGAVDVIIDFTSPASTRALLDHCVRLGTPLVIGTTGLSPDDHAAIDAAARTIAVLQAANTSVGVSVLVHLVEETARLLGDGFDLEVVEAHHRHKRDAPSGTALALVSALERGRSGLSRTFARHGDIGPRPQNEIGVQTIRGGDVIGEHTVFYLGSGERLELTHRATDRSLFANGALKAASWLAGRPAGRYTMRDALGL
ncbi:MAG: 4-hydroxy-tetrahydrodipicolinate reductase [Myxococcales bacterium]|nr:4-hydroxy-tetrahydrodipicolinate reductase [Myxococcales bacterium]